MFLIGVSGAHGVGKSTVISGLKRMAGDELLVVSNIAKGVIEKGFQLGKYADVDAYVCLVAEYLSSKNSLRSTTSQIVLYDRTILDTLSYAITNLDYGKQVKNHVIDLLRAVWESEKKDFSAYFYIPIEFPEADPDKNGPDEGYRSMVSDSIHRNLDLSKVGHTILSGAPDVRLDQLLSKIRKLGAPI